MDSYFGLLFTPIGFIGLIGQACFFGRFLVQWIVSEKEGRSTIPVAFWLLSLCGGIMVLIYALWRRDPLFTLGQSVGLFVYLRNLVLIWRERRRRGATVESGVHQGSGLVTELSADRAGPSAVEP